MRDTVPPRFRDGSTHRSPSIWTLHQQIDVCQYVDRNGDDEGGTVTAVRELPVLRQPDVQACCAPLASEVLSEPEAAVLARQFAALADPVRLRLVSLLSTAEGGAV